MRNKDGRSRADARKLVRAVHVRLTRQGYTSDGIYFGTGQRLYEIEEVVPQPGRECMHGCRAASAHEARLNHLYGEKCFAEGCTRGAWRDFLDHDRFAHCVWGRGANFGGWRGIASVNVSKRSGKDRNGRPLALPSDPWVCWFQLHGEKYETGLASARVFASDKEARDAALVAVLIFDGTASL